MKRISFLTLLSMLLPITLNAVMINGINYDFCGYNSAQVISYHMRTLFDYENDPEKLKKTIEEEIKNYINKKDDKKNYSGEIKIPEYVIYKGKKYRVTSIEDRAFYGCKDLTSVTIPSSMLYIKSSAFEGCSGLTSITIPQGMVSLCNYAFAGCTGLTSISIPRSVTFIDRSVFADCSNLTSILVEEGNRIYDSRNGCNAIIKKEDNTLISGCKNTIIPKSVKCISGNAFKGCIGLTSITIPRSVTSIDRSAFSDCTSLATIKVEPGNPTYDSRGDCNAIIETKTNKLIAGCKGTVIPHGVTDIGMYALENCSGLTSITIPEGVTNIDFYAFAGCQNLTTVSIQSSVISIGAGAFHKCTSLTDVYCYTKECPPVKTTKGLIRIESDIFNDSIIASATLHVPAGTAPIYKAQGPWSRFGNIVEMEDQTSDISHSIVIKIIGYILLVIVFVLLYKRLTKREDSNYNKSLR